MPRNPKAAKSKGGPKSDGARVIDLEQRLAEAHEQQAATAEILRVISRSPTDVQPVFDAVAESAARLCESFDSIIWRPRADHLVVVAHHGPIPHDPGGLPLTRESVPGRALLDGATLHLPDLQAEADEFPVGSDAARRYGFRTTLNVPLMRDGAAIGVITLRRTEIRPFSERQVALVNTFADQAVIAIENTRLFNETNEALERQTATSEILRVISSSPTDVQPVFDAIAESAVGLCDALFGGIFRVDGKNLRAVGRHGPLAPQGFVMPITRGSVAGRAVLERRPVHVIDLQTEAQEFPEGSAIAKELGHRTTLGVPLLREGTALGAIVVRRAESEPFTDKQIALLETFADQAVIAIENVRLFTELQAKNRALIESLEQQTATADILRVISSSPTDVQPVFQSIAESAVRLSGGLFGSVYRFDGELIHMVAHHNYPSAALEFSERIFPMRPSRQAFTGRAILERAVVNVGDVSQDQELNLILDIAGRVGFQSVLSVPLMHDGSPVGAITVWRSTVGLFSDEHIALLQTFADQAVIAIENVRLFKELEARNRDLSEALDQQTATSEILRVISSSPTDVQPVFDAIIQNAVRLCGSSNGTVFRFDGHLIHVAAHHNFAPEAADVVNRVFPLPADRGTVTGRAILTRSVVHVADLASDTDYTRPALLEAGFRAILAVPMFRDAAPIGAITVTRRRPEPFSEGEISLLQTFAEQAVIAIENVRLFKELDAKNHELTTALDQQTATSEILRSISSSLTDVQPVFDIIVQSGVRLLGGYSATMTLLRDEQLELVAYTSTGAEGDASLRHLFPCPLHSLPPGERAVRERRTYAMEDAESGVDVTDAMRETIQARGWRSGLFVPMLREEAVVGLINVTRRNAGPFASDEVALIETFAAQAVIAIENARLFNELQARTGELTRSVDELTALGDVSRALSSTLDVDVVLDTIVTRASDLIGADGCTIFEYDEAAEQFHLRATRDLEPRLVELARGTPLRRGDQSILGRLPSERQAVQVPDITVGSYSSPISAALIEAGYRAVLAVPLVREDRLIGALTMNRKTPGEFPPETIKLLQTFATQSALAIQNAQLFREIEVKSRQLEVASQHKSEFLANMSHELRTPLNAIIGFSEVLTDRMFGELNEKQEEYLKDIYASGTHLLSLINDILDLSKIEAGRMELELTEFDLPTAIENALMLVRERAGRRSIAVHTNIDKRLGQIHADERKIRQVVLNLLSNAIKFTPEGGGIEVGAALRDGFVEVSVSDTGIGIAPEDQDKVFEEFRQVGTAAKKVEGTGLGLTLCRKFVELHGGRIWVKSQLAAGSTFTFTIPVQRSN